MTLDHRTIRNGFGRFATGVTVVTCRNDDGEPHGATVNAFTAVSLEPALCQVTLTRESKACRFLDGKPFAVNVLAADQVDAAWTFAGRPQGRPAPRWADGPTAPVLLGTAATISCLPWRTYDGGDHLIVIGEVAHLHTSDADPLLFFGGAFREIAARTADHWMSSVDCPDLGWFGSGFAPLRTTSTLKG
ncbi:flavin reductase family protein [Lentzea albida]|uniref:NADH-FMN oxidoreductase RutF, flavin reductase (DIM6/NTAB) family n=1 Tax=Lentzea albida TaxID=65499 RepID=A0A1H9QAP1_9PSEU|nr:flavin reductase family protein [Lentzea albida]SER57478.1 NADH-FMN oxidoreductase RutF, flavin reductase (DIM6/NTAB) family [Lentzea albida]